MVLRKKDFTIFLKRVCCHNFFSHPISDSFRIKGYMQILKFCRTWKDRRRHLNNVKKQSRPALVCIVLEVVKLESE